MTLSAPYEKSKSLPFKDPTRSNLEQSANPSCWIWVDWDPGQSSPFKAEWDSVGQCEMDWDNAYPLDIHGIGMSGRLGQRPVQGELGRYPWHWHPWVGWDSVQS